MKLKSALLLKLRMMKGARLLLEGKRVQEVARELHYGHHQHFISRFKRAFWGDAEAVIRAAQDRGLGHGCGGVSSRGTAALQDAGAYLACSTQRV